MLIVFAAGWLMAGAPAMLAQSHAAGTTGGIRGQVADPTGAVIPGATVVVRSTSGQMVGKATSDAGGVYAVHGLKPGIYGVFVTAPGFAAFSVPHIVVSGGQMKNVNPALKIEVAQQEVQVQAENDTTISTSPDANASAVVIKGAALNALSDDPDELQNELEALAGPAAGPNGGQIYIDGFTGGQLPPKSAIREIRVNQNPFSAEYERLGYGRIEILTKPGSEKLHGGFHVAGNDSSFNSQNPILAGTTEPPYHSWFIHGDLNGPISKNSSYFFSLFSRQQQNESVLEAIDPASIVATPSGIASTQVNEAIANPTSRLDLSPRVDMQLGAANTLTVRDEYNRSVSTNGGLNALSLPSQAINVKDQDNTVQISDSVVISKNLVDDIRFQYRRIRNTQSAVSNLPSFGVQGSFTDGGSSSQTVQDHENDLELQNYFSGAEGRHSLNFGARLRAYPDANYTTGGSNGAYTFANTSDFVGCLQNPPAASCHPEQYSYTKINNPVARAIPFDAALFYQDDWKVNPRLTFSYGLRWETQNWISDKNDWAPRVMLAYALGKSSGRQQPKTVVRAGYGWFYQRFNVANGFGAQVPYVIQTIHENGQNEQQFIRNQSSGENIIPFNPNAVTPLSSGAGSAGRNAPTFYSIAPHFHAANDMEAAAGMDRQLAKRITGNVTYIFSQGIHEYFTDNLSAAAVFPAAAADSDTYPATPVSEPPTNDLQYQSGGFYKEHQVMMTVRANYGWFSFFTNYTYSHAMGDTSGVGTVPSVSSDPGLDYGRTSFDVRNRFMLFGNLMLPYQVSFSPMVVVHSGTPYNVTTGSDLTGNNQFNARPTYAASCSEADTVQTQFGCLNVNPYGTGEKIIPYGVGTGPANVSMNMRLAKVIGVGPKLSKGEHAAGGGGYHGGRGGMGGGGFSGSRGGPGRLDAEVTRKYSLTLSAWITNLLNHENLGTPNGVLAPGSGSTASGLNPLFGKSQSLAGGFFGSNTGGNRSIYVEARFDF
jgi:hypothetical protein